MPTQNDNAGEIRLRQFLEKEGQTLHKTLRFYITRAGLADQRSVVEVLADELLNDVTVEALAHADRFHPDGQPRAWLLGIAANLIKRRQADLARRQQREPLARDLIGDDPDMLSDDELFDRLAGLQGDTTAARLESDEEVSAILEHLTPLDREVIRLAVLGDLDGERLAEALKITPGAARVRLHRALNRLRAALLENRKEGSHE